MGIRSGVFGVACALAIGTAGMAAAGSTVVLGPPAVCVPVECEGAGVKIGDASKGAFATVRGYSAGEAMGDGVAALAESDDVLSHMETVRRVVVYLSGEEEKSQAFLARLLARAAEAEADRAPAGERALAWFDAGYFVGASEQMGVGVGWKPGEGEKVLGLGWLERAAGYASSEGAGVDVAAIHFAAANVAHPAMRQMKRDLYERHMRAAVSGAERGSLLWKNLERHAEHWDESLKGFGG